jgi:predicted transposase/invertase (TIGR01784 family)
LNREVSVQEILESQANTDRKDGKTPRLDLKAKIDDGELAIFEIQYEDRIDFMGKMLYNVSVAVVEQVTIGEEYDVKKVYSINIAYDAMGAKQEYLFTASVRELKGVNFDETLPFSQNLDDQSDVQKEIHPEYFLILPKKFDGTMRSKFDEWVYVLKHSTVKSEFTAAGVQAASEKLDVLKMTPEQREEYEREKQYLMTQKSQLYTAELKGVKRGREEGREEGRAEGREEGEAIGKTNTLEQVVIDGKQNGFSIEQIKLFSKLPEQQIIEILKKHGLM